ncbi:MAG TPA: ThuA domain-containing protein [Bryobacteraceae bacterium]|nr:ThuA domain-containing protein [Bryobacteraceae bacterium]
MRTAGAWAALGLILAAAQAAGPIRVLLVSGSGAEERAGAALLGDALRQAGRFVVFTSDDPGAITPAALARYDVLAVDCDGKWWGDAAQAAVERFVHQGKGLVAVRAGDCAAGPEAGRRRYAAMTATVPAAMPGTQGNHPLRVQSAGSTFLTVDDPGPGIVLKPEAKVVASAGQQPLSWTAAYGKGRVFQSRLGRNPAVRREPEFVVAFVRAVEWAGTGGVAPPPQPFAEAAAIKTLVVTGGHTYDASFYELFENQPGVTATIDPHPLPYRRGDLRNRYDTLVLYDSMQEITDAERRNLVSFVESGKGVVILHHALVDYSDWPWWYGEVMGARWLKVGGPGSKWKTTYEHDVDLLVYPVGEHPVTAGIGPMRIQDETYKGMWLSPDIQVLMKTDHPSSDGPVVWLSPYRKSRVVVIELGHDRKAHLHPGYRKLVGNAIRWSAGKE